MSSGILISGTDDGFRPWHFFVLVSILMATVAVILARQSSPGHLILLSLTIAAAGAAAAAFHRVLSPLLNPAQARAMAPVSERTRAALDREKRLVLRSIKELEFDRAMGKLSPKDFEEMSGRLRSRALSLMQQLDTDESGYAQAIEAELQKRIAAAPLPAPHAEAGVRAVCASCETPSDIDAVFCKKCGTRLRA